MIQMMRKYRSQKKWQNSLLNWLRNWKSKLIYRYRNNCWRF
jgi:hypothetical protein